MKIDVEIIEVRVRLSDGVILEVMTPYGPAILREQLSISKETLQRIVEEIEIAIREENNGTEKRI